MSTNSVIGVMHGSKCKAIRCHWDGYLSYNGAKLQQYYDSAKANHLVALGNISSLKAKLEKSEGSTHSFDTPEKDVTIFYGRDRQEVDQEHAVYFSLAEMHDAMDVEFYYIMKDGAWYVSDDGETIQTLGNALNNEAQGCAG